MKKLLLLFSGLLYIVIQSQDRKQWLIVSHMDNKSGNTFRQKIYAYKFINGSFTGREELLIVQGKKDGKDYIRTDLGKPTIYRNRYLITGIGNIIDLKEKKVLFDGSARLVACRNDSAIFYTNDIFKGKFYSVYNFKTNQYGEVKQYAFKAIVGQDVEFDKSVSPYKIYLYPPNKPKIELVSDAGYGQKGKDGPEDPPLNWLNNDEFIYVWFSKDGKELAVYKINATNKKSELIGKATGPGIPSAYFEKHDNDTYVLCFQDKQFKVDLKNKKVEELAFTIPAYGFSSEIKSGPKGKRILLKDEPKEIGTFHYRLSFFSAHHKICALVKEIVAGEDSYQQGMMVWNDVKKKFESVDSEDVVAMLGWIEE
ncbi:MAG: hypothetical protein N3F09_00890 [Bacteroidia bacterium]|nr:hypothetical protein [Bacteroidia bacterium]